MVQAVNVSGQLGAIREASGNHWEKICLEGELRQTSQKLHALALCFFWKIDLSVIWISSEVSLSCSPFT